MRAVNLDELRAKLLAGRLTALARAISLVDAGSSEGRQLLAALEPRHDHTRVIGITGTPGAGKSSLINALIAELRRAERSVAVVAVDPSSPLTGGAVLGDRTRMSEHASDPGVFIRSVSGRGHLGGLSRSTESIITLLAAAGWPLVILETIGTGQSEIDVLNVADVNVVVNAPGLGDDVQAIKAGVLEIADVLVVNKADLPHAEQTVCDLRAMLQHRKVGRRDIPVLQTVAVDGRGVAALLAEVDVTLSGITPERRRARLRQRTRQTLARAVADEVLQRVASADDARVDSLCEDLLDGRCEPDEAVRRLLGWIL